MIYHNIKEEFKEHHNELIKIILDAAPADKIYFLGATLISRRTESIFMTDAPSCRYVGHYFVLVLVSNEHDCNAVQDKIENNCRHFIPVTAIVLHTTQFKDWLREEHLFAYKVVTLGAILYSSDETRLVADAVPIDELIKAQNESTYNEGCNKVNEFLAGADLYRLRNQNKMAAFMLHQAAEHALHTMLKIGTGLYINTHNLDKLMRYCCMVSWNLPEIFARKYEKDERLFQLLQKAYVGGRYKDDYNISISELNTIAGKVKELQNLLKETIL